MLAEAWGVHPLPAARSPRGRDTYRAAAADTAAFVRARRPTVSQLALVPMFRAAVEAGLELEGSPQQISHRLRLDHPDDPVMRVSHEPIYLATYQPHRRAVKAKLHRQLRTGRLMRHPTSSAIPSTRGRLTNMVLLAERRAEVEDRLVPGHWKGDLVMGTCPSAVATLAERTTRYLRVLALPGGIKAAPVRTAVDAISARLNGQPRRILGWRTPAEAYAAL